MTAIARRIIRLAKDHGFSIGAIESITGGALLSALTSVSGASLAIKGGLVVYTNEEKEKLLHIPRKTLQKHGSISAETAIEMANRGRYRLNVDVCVALTGNAGPQAAEGKPNGLCYLAIATAMATEVNELHLQGTRISIRRQCVEMALKKIEEILLRLIK